MLEMTLVMLGNDEKRSMWVRNRVSLPMEGRSIMLQVGEGTPPSRGGGAKDQGGHVGFVINASNQ